MMKDVEVEIRRPFNDPAKRIKAMRDLFVMLAWLESCSPKDGILYCDTDGSEIVWKFGGTWRSGSPVAVEFNHRFA